MRQPFTWKSICRQFTFHVQCMHTSPDEYFLVHKFSFIFGISRNFVNVLLILNQLPFTAIAFSNPLHFSYCIMNPKERVGGGNVTVDIGVITIQLFFPQIINSCCRNYGSNCVLGCLHRKGTFKRGNSIIRNIFLLTYPWSQILMMRESKLLSKQGQIKGMVIGKLTYMKCHCRLSSSVNNFIVELISSHCSIRHLCLDQRAFTSCGKCCHKGGNSSKKFVLDPQSRDGKNRMTFVFLIKWAYRGSTKGH